MCEGEDLDACADPAPLYPIALHITSTSCTTLLPIVRNDADVLQALNEPLVDNAVSFQTCVDVLPPTANDVRITFADTGDSKQLLWWIVGSTPNIVRLGFTLPGIDVVEWSVAFRVWQGTTCDDFEFAIVGSETFLEAQQQMVVVKSDPSLGLAVGDVVILGAASGSGLPGTSAQFLRATWRMLYSSSM